MEIQRNLSKFQAFPIVGFIVISPIKAAVSLLQIAVNAVALIVLVSFCCCIPNMGEKFVLRMFDFLAGWVHLAYSILNFITFGIGGCVVHNCCCFL